MPSSTYSFSVDSSGLVYTFTSIGVQLLTKKLIFTAINPHYYNVELRTEKDDEQLPDTENSNNGDMFTVLRTCAAIIQHFMNAHPAIAVYISGSDNRRQRYYKRMLATAIKADEDLKVFGLFSDGRTEPFQESGKYEACLVFHL